MGAVACCLVAYGANVAPRPDDLLGAHGVRLGYIDPPLLSPWHIIPHGNIVAAIVAGAVQ